MSHSANRTVPHQKPDPVTGDLACLGERIHGGQGDPEPFGYVFRREHGGTTYSMQRRAILLDAAGRQADHLLQVVPAQLDGTPVHLHLHDFLVLAAPRACAVVEFVNAPIPQATRPTGTLNRSAIASPNGGKKAAPRRRWHRAAGRRQAASECRRRRPRRPVCVLNFASPWLAELDCPATTNTSPTPTCGTSAAASSWPFAVAPVRQTYQPPGETLLPRRTSPSVWLNSIGNQSPPSCTSTFSAPAGTGH